MPLLVPPDVAPVLILVIGVVPTVWHTAISLPALTVGVVPQVMFVVEDGFVPAQAPLPVAVKVRVPLPVLDVGVKVAPFNELEPAVMLPVPVPAV